MIKGNERENQKAPKYVGFTVATLKAINPTKSQQNQLLGREDSEDDKEVTYLSQDQEGNDRLRLSFWLHDEKLDKYFVYGFNMTNKERVSKDGAKNQYINSTCTTSWTNNEALLPKFFTHFLDKDKNELGEKKVRKAIMGEQELATLLRSWLGKMRWGNPECEVVVDTKALFNEDYSELRELINSKWATPFTILTGVRTDQNDPEKQYQSVYGKAFLPAEYMDYINTGLNFKKEFDRKEWEKFENEVNGDWGFEAYFELVPIKVYDPKVDPAAAVGTRAGVTPTNSKW